MFEIDEQLAAKMAAAAERAAHEERWLGRRLDFTPQSVAALEAVATEIARGGHTLDVNGLDDYGARVIAALGAYLGETMRRNVGGDWGWRVAGAERTATLRTANGALFADPVAKVRRRVEAGPDENLQTYYYVAEHWLEIAGAVEDDESRAQAANEAGYILAPRAPVA